MPLIFWQDIHLQYQTGIGHEVAVIRMGGTSRFVRVKTRFGAFLVTVQWLISTGCSVRVRNRIVDGVALHRGGVLHRFIARMAQSSLATLFMPNSLQLVAGLACCRDLIRIKNMELGRGIEIYLSILKTGLIGLMKRRLTIMPASNQILTETD